VILVDIVCCPFQHGSAISQLRSDELKSIDGADVLWDPCSIILRTLRAGDAGEHSSAVIPARKFDDFSAREVASPLSRCSEIEPIDSKSGLCHPTKDSGGEMETENQRISEPTGISLG
jgi:hypothetical protein